MCKGPGAIGFGSNSGSCRATGASAWTREIDRDMGCGTSSGRDTNKIAKTGIEMQDVPESETRVPLHTKVAIRCTLKEYLEVGEHYLYICNVEDVLGNETEEALFAWDGYAKIAPARQ